MLNKKIKKITGKKNKSLAVAIIEISILLLSVFSFAYILGSEFPVVSAQEFCTRDKNEKEVRLSEVGVDIDAWCNANGNDEVCSKSGGRYSGLREQHVCSGQEQTTGIPSVSNIPSIVAGKLGENVISRAFSRNAGKTISVTMSDGNVVTGVLNKEGNKWVLKTAEGATQELNPAELAKQQGWIKRNLLTSGKGGFWNPGDVLNSLKWGGITAIIAGVIKFFSVRHATGDSARAAEAGIRVGGAAAGGYLAGVGIVSLTGGPAGVIITTTIIVAIWFANKFLTREQQRLISFQCTPWQAQTGGSNCELCNNKEFPCTEYQCRSLGSGCEIINKDTDEPRCVHKDPRDVDPPNITAWTDILTDDYRYDPLPQGQFGVEIKHLNEECLPAFQPFTFGVQLNKEGFCRIEFERTASFEDMRFDFGGRNLFNTNHSQTMSFPGAAHLEQAGILNITNDGEFEFYVRCQAASNGKSNREEFLFKFCTEKGPDTTSPIIRGFNWNDKSAIGYFGENEPREVNTQVYTNEPAQCRWAHEDKNYEDMENSLICSNNIDNFNAQLSYTCSGKLTGLENNQENKFFFRCNDTFGNVNIQSKTLSLIGTQPLVIDEIAPNGTIKDSTDSIKVTLEAETSAGANEGRATCSYSSSGESATYVKFQNTDSHTHSTNLWLEPGSYSYFIRCIDSAGNSDTEQTSFIVESDTQTPVVVRAYRESNYMNIITNEEAECVYSDNANVGCSYLFEPDGISMQNSEGNKHQTAWNPSKTFYIKCQDEFGNQPAPNACSIVVSPYSIK